MTEYRIIHRPDERGAWANSRASLHVLGTHDRAYPAFMWRMSGTTIILTLFDGLTGHGLHVRKAGAVEGGAEYTDTPDTLFADYSTMDTFTLQTWVGVPAWFRRHGLPGWHLYQPWDDVWSLINGESGISPDRTLLARWRDMGCPEYDLSKPPAPPKGGKPKASLVGRPGVITLSRNGKPVEQWVLGTSGRTTGDARRWQPDLPTLFDGNRMMEHLWTESPDGLNVSVALRDGPYRMEGILPLRDPMLDPQETWERMMTVISGRALAASL